DLKGYYMGMGRGSAAGSLVAYALDITGIDPIRHDLLFERFLNKERYSMPDIDIDLPDIYRSEFLRYVRNRYGSDHSAQIVTFSTFGPKQAIRDVFKRFGVPEYELTNLTKKIGFKDSLATVYEKNISFRQTINSRVEFQKAFTIA
ncbi:DNA polymerase III subunit alpha, partial [Streptococcus pyogenes]